MSERKSRSGFIPAYDKARIYLKILDGQSHRDLLDMCKDIDSHRGSPQATTEWSDPDRWIPERLRGNSRYLAYKIWRESGRAIKPSFLKGYRSLCRRHRLIKPVNGKLTLTKAGNLFLDNNVDFIARMDRFEGMFLILADLAELGPGMSKDFLDNYRLFCRRCTNWQSDESINSTHTQRLKNMAHRGLVYDYGGTYEITSAGEGYLMKARVDGQVEPEGFNIV